MLDQVNAENAAATVEAEACAAIAKEVAELQAKCEAELAAAEPLVQQAEAALNTLQKKVGQEVARFGACSGGASPPVAASAAVKVSLQCCHHCTLRRPPSHSPSC